MNGSLPNLRDLYEEIWLADFEYALSPEGRPIPVCMVAHEGYDRKPKLRLCPAGWEVNLEGHLADNSSLHDCTAVYRSRRLSNSKSAFVNTWSTRWTGVILNVFCTVAGR